MPPKENVSSDPISQIASTIKSANNVLITVSANPSVDQLAACIALTVAVNKLKKHGTAVFSGRVPSTIEFLKPEETLERNTDSLRDFIISLDKSKADKLRYKVEDNVVKIFITPYKTSISDRDLEFTQGDFNVDAVITLGVHEKTDFDEAIMAHGRILHDATIASINTTTKSEIGAINWVDAKASSLCEMVSDLIVRIDDKLLDPQISTALLTGMVAETDRFGNDKASPHTMSVSGTLMSAGASPQLIASKLEEPEPPAQEKPRPVERQEEQSKNPDGMIEIDHTAENKPGPEPEPPKPEEVPHDEIHIDDQGKLRKAREFLDHEPEEFHEQKATSVNPGMVLEPPRFGGQLTAASVPDEEQYAGRPQPYVVHGSTQPSTNEPPQEEPRRTEEPQPPQPQPPQPPQEEPPRYDPPPSPPPQEAQQYIPEPQPPQLQQYEEPPQPSIANVSDNQTLVEIEQAVHSPHVSVFEGPAAPDPALDELSRVARQVAEDADARPYALESMGTTGQLMPDHSDELPGPPPQIIPDHMSPPLEEPAPLPDPTDGPPPPTPPPLTMPPPVA